MENIRIMYTQIMDQIGAGIAAFFNFLLISIISAVGVVLSVFIAKKLISQLLLEAKIKKNKRREDAVFLSVKIPATSEKKEDAMEEFLRSLHRVLPNNTTLSLELASSDQFIRFYIVIPKAIKNLVESQLYAQYPDAEVDETSDYLPDKFDKNVACAQLYFKRSSIYPFNTYHNLNEGILKTLSAVLSKTEKGEKVYIQIVLKRVGPKFWERNLPALFFQLFGVKSVDEKNPHPAFWKLSQEVYLGKLQFAYSASDFQTAKGKLNAILGLLKSTKGSHNELKKKRFVITRPIQEAIKARVFSQGDIWTPAEIATIYHFQYKGTIVSNVVHTTSKRAPAPDILPREGLVNPKEVSFIGETNYRNEGMRFGIKRIDRRRHLYVVGKTGSGKSKLLELLLISDIQNGEGCCLLDPHGDLADELLKFVPRERIKDVVYVNPIDRDFPIGFNPLEPVKDYQMRQHISTFFIAIFKKLLAFNWNPRMEHVMRYITLALLETPDSNVLGIQRMLSDATFRQRVIKQIQDPIVKSFWTNDFKASDHQFINEAVLPILNKVGQFTANPFVRNMIGQKKNMLNFGAFMNEGKIVIISISKGKLGDENSALLGSMIITKIQQAALARANIAEEERRDFYFYVDEFQNFATDAFSTILSEARKYHLNLTIAHQYIEQLPEEVKATAFGNVGSLISFAVGGDDASYLAKEFAPVFAANDLINLNIREMYVKMSVDGKLTTPFSAKTIDVPRPNFNYAKEAIDYSRMTYGKNRVAVENEIARWSSVVDSASESDTGDGFPQPIL